jgi:hypothetical protein
MLRERKGGQKDRHTDMSGLFRHIVDENQFSKKGEDMSETFLMQPSYCVA